MKKDLIALFAIILMIAVLINGTNIQSVDEYYLTHIDDITPDSETVTISIRCDTILRNYDDLDPALRSPEYVPPDGVILPVTEYVLRPGDTVFDILGAKALGIPALGVSWGYGDVAEMNAAGAIAMMDSPAELTAFLLK